MFWWFHYTIAEGVKDPTERPLILWLQGGPGMSSSAYGNFFTLGPLNEELKPRES